MQLTIDDSPLTAEIFTQITEIDDEKTNSSPRRSEAREES